ncbi:MAG: hypothetical protein COY04_00780 [Parcubacteria group bacterium CG_4_10_14_0_2_um_filter_7_35_8]|nr:MAG: hypothetical protein COV79_05195 [Parcubacteria group bacterium CG11_big_fil_rev_8_21_14_0_20_41_14]PIZ77004.1 MAG: hypothetical protein COY04_00780 [Parcubacteria group bacterium CG_4_10_14_0_2_um_filter_7_35_8]PJC40594.1 MAG: hypothetical protein CO042_02980 [Parcubacteria group bacterium CG_4_9_14_0_2_um_filter_41_8]
MRKLFAILSILLFIILIVIPFSITNADDNTKSTTTTEFINKEFNAYKKQQLISHKLSRFDVQSSNKTKYKIVMDFLKDISERIVGIIFLISISFIIWHYCLHNFYIKARFKRERTEKRENFKIARCKEENTKNRVYAVVYNTKKDKDEDKKGKYYHIADDYTFKGLGYNSGDDAPRNNDGSYNEKEFSKENKKLGSKIKLYDIKQDIVFIFSSAQKMEELKKYIGDIQ